MHKLFFIAVAASLAGLGCLLQVQAAEPGETAPEVEADEVLSAALAVGEAVGEPIAFVSHNGEMVGGDEDSKIELWADGSARLTHYGFALMQYEGTYTLAEDELVFAFADAMQNEYAWPKMRMVPNEYGLLLVPAEDVETGPFAGHSEGYWDFALVPDEEESSGD